MPTTAYTPIIIPITVTSGGVVLDFSSVGRMAAITLVNMDPTKVIYGSFDGVPPSAAIQAGVFALDPTVEPILNLENIEFVTIGLISSGNAVLQAIAFERPGGGTGGGGFGG